CVAGVDGTGDAAVGEPHDLPPVGGAEVGDMPSGDLSLAGVVAFTDGVDVGEQVVDACGVAESPPVQLRGDAGGVGDALGLVAADVGVRWGVGGVDAEAGGLGFLPGPLVDPADVDVAGFGPVCAGRGPHPPVAGEEGLGGGLLGAAGLPGGGGER